LLNLLSHFWFNKFSLLLIIIFLIYYSQKKLKLPTKHISYYFNLILLSLVFFVLFSCSREKAYVSDEKTATVGTFNLEWLGDGINDRNHRSENDYKEIADIILKSGVDMLAVQEVENNGAIARILRYLSGYKFILSKDGGAQKVGFIYKTDISVEKVSEYSPLEVEPGRTKPGLLVKVKKKNFDWLMMAVHFKSTSHYDDTIEKQDNSRIIRSLQSRALSNWVDSVCKYSLEKDIIIAGDFNDSPLNKKNCSLEALSNNRDISFISAGLMNCRFKGMRVIDQIVANNSSLTRLLKNSARVYNFYNYLSLDRIDKISDHCPVLAQFDVTAPDND
jgi:endonuclease/exonuclease/phosphatase family metal-dependent hydrolase